jgi:hypothetical protein
MLDINEMEWQYSVVNTQGIFIGLNSRAVDLLMENGDWLKLTDAADYGYTNEFGMLFISNDSKANNFCNLIGSLYKDNVIPTFVHDWFPYKDSNSSDDEVKFMPLYRYKMDTNKIKNEWLYETIDDKKSQIYDHIKLLCLKDSEGNRMYEWTENELEIAELMMEYQLG